MSGEDEQVKLHAGTRRAAIEGRLSERLRAALEAHLAFWPFDLRPVPGGRASFDVSPLHPFVVRRFELDSVGCRLVHGRLYVEFVTRGLLRDTLGARGFHPAFEAWIPGLAPAHALSLGASVATPEIHLAARLAVVAGVEYRAPSRQRL